jgi:hypothetical protein
MDKKTNKRKQIPSLHVFPLNEDTSEHIINSDEIKNYIYKNTYECLVDASLRRKKYAQIFRLNNTEFYLEIPENQWNQAINSCICYFEKEQEFEKCAVLTKLKSKIKNN